MAVVVEQVAPGFVLPLRARVLRPGRAAREAVFEGDAEGEHFAAFDGRGEIVGVASLLAEPTPRDHLPARRLRGMAIDEAVRGTGVGARLLAAVLAQAGAEGADLVWCAARLGAVGFYERFGFVGVGVPYDVEPIGSHLEMRRGLARDEPSGRGGAAGESR